MKAIYTFLAAAVAISVNAQSYIPLKNTPRLPQYEQSRSAKADIKLVYDHEYPIIDSDFKQIYTWEGVEYINSSSIVPDYYADESENRYIVELGLPSRQEPLMVSAQITWRNTDYLYIPGEHIVVHIDGKGASAITDKNGNDIDGGLWMVGYDDNTLYRYPDDIEFVVYDDGTAEFTGDPYSGFALLNSIGNAMIGSPAIAPVLKQCNCTYNAWLYNSQSMPDLVKDNILADYDEQNETLSLIGFLGYNERVELKVQYLGSKATGNPAVTHLIGLHNDDTGTQYIKYPLLLSDADNELRPVAASLYSDADFSIMSMSKAYLITPPVAELNFADYCMRYRLESVNFTMEFPIHGLIEIGLNGIDDVDDTAADTPIYYNLQGIRIDNPSHGTFIRVQGKSTAKVLIK